MKELKKSPRQQLEKFSTIFMQLGLVLVLFVVFISLEHETEQTAEVVTPVIKEPREVFFFDKIPVFEKEVIKKAKPKVEILKKTILIDKPEVVPDETKITKSVIIQSTEELPKFNIDDVVVMKTDDPIDDVDDPKPISLDFVTKIPVFKGCENLDEIKGRKCFDKKMSKLVKRHFNSGLANELGLKKGKNKILTQFVIDRAGNVVDVKIRAPHARLEKETQRVINKIPSFTPGEKNGEPANVRYTLPISFKVE